AAGKLVAGEARLGAQVFRSCTTVPAMPARSPEPRNADSIADPVTRRTGTDRFDAADDLVTGNERQHRIGQLAIDDVQIRAADGARLDAQQQLAFAGLWNRKRTRRKPFTGLFEHHGPHRNAS